MKPFIDIHCHINIFSDEKISEVVAQAKKNNVNIILNNGEAVESNRKTLEISKKFPEVKAALGIYSASALHLTDAKINSEIDFIRRNAKNIFAVGEVGIDLKESDDFEKQKEIFEKFIKLAQELGKPIIVHSRKAEKEVIEILERLYNKNFPNQNFYPVIMHCFCGKKKLVKQIIDNGWFLSIPTNVTYNEQFQEIVKVAPIEQLFCETDSPFLHPQKGERDNEPANVIQSYQKIAEIKGISLREVRDRIFGNYNNLFFG